MASLIIFFLFSRLREDMTYIHRQIYLEDIYLVKSIYIITYLFYRKLIKPISLKTEKPGNMQLFEFKVCRYFKSSGRCLSFIQNQMSATTTLSIQIKPLNWSLSLSLYEPSCLLLLVLFYKSSTQSSGWLAFTRTLYQLLENRLRRILLLTR